VKKNGNMPARYNRWNRYTSYGRGVTSKCVVHTAQLLRTSSTGVQAANFLPMLFYFSKKCSSAAAYMRERQRGS